MIQRIQSVFLLLMAIVMLTMLFMPIWVKKGNLDTEELVVLNTFNLTYTHGSVEEVVAQKSTIYISILVMLSVGVSIFSLFQYKNRLNQIKLGALNSLFGMGIVLTSLYFTNKGQAMLNPELDGEYKIGFFLPVMALIFNTLANRYIKRDERLVQDSNRMR